MARILILLGGTIHAAAAGFHVALPWLAAMALLYTVVSVRRSPEPARSTP